MAVNTGILGGMRKHLHIELPEDRELSRAWLKLALAAKIVLARVLGLMGVGAPERM